MTSTQTKKFLPFALPDINDDEINEVVDSLKSGWLTTGPKTKRFESDFTEFLGGGVFSLAVNSATSGLHLALEAVGVGEGDEVITTTYTFTATAEVVRYLGADPIFVDIDRGSMQISAEKIEEAISPKTKAIIVVHFAGYACDMAKVLSIAKKHNLRVIEDAAHALPTTYNGKLIGTLDSDATVFSFYATKTIATGEGGMLITKNSEIAKRCAVMRLHGIDRDAFDRYSTDKPSWYYEIIAPGFKYNMTDIVASLGIHQLKKAYNFQEKRQKIAEYYSREFVDLPLSLPIFPKNDDMHAWHLYVIRLNDDCKIERNDFINTLSKKGIGTSVHFIPLHIHPYWRDRYNLKPEDFPIAFDSYKRAVSLPIYTKMTESDIQLVVDSIKEILS
ncbi:MAG: DegT/DnrJ/EryC1/StrS family aminotransferase [Armatimonadota bacterium]